MSHYVLPWQMQDVALLFARLWSLNFLWFLWARLPLPVLRAAGQAECLARGTGQLWVFRTGIGDSGMWTSESFSMPTAWAWCADQLPCSLLAVFAIQLS